MKKLKNMRSTFRQSGFSLTEVLMAVGILTVGLVLVATMFPLGMSFTAVSVERTMAAVVADEAFAKIQIYGVDVSLFSTGNSEIFYDPNDGSTLSNIYYMGSQIFEPNELSYPASEPNSPPQYYWSAVCRLLDPGDTTVQVTVFVARKTSPGQTFGNNIVEPTAVKINISATAGNDEITTSASDDTLLINPSSTIIDNKTGHIYSILDKDNIGTITLDRDWQGNSGAEDIWTMPPPKGGGKNAEIGVFQRIIKF